MGCCTVPAKDTARFFSRLAGFHRLRFRVFGFEDTQRHLIEGIKQAGLSGASLLEIGCGPGYLHQGLLQSGAGRAVGVDLSERMLREARHLADRGGLAGRTEYRQGDFVALAPRLGSADITILDKVVCCYPDVEALLRCSLDKTRRVYALTYPRDRRLTRMGVALMARWLRLIGSEFRTYVHPPQRIRAEITARGFQRLYAQDTRLWASEIYVHESCARPSDTHPL